MKELSFTLKLQVDAVTKSGIDNAKWLLECHARPIVYNQGNNFIYDDISRQASILLKLRRARLIQLFRQLQKHTTTKFTNPTAPVTDYYCNNIPQQLSSLSNISHLPLVGPLFNFWA